MTINTQTILENDHIILYPLQEKDFDTLYALASDPKIWKQHPNNDRWKEDVFRVFFNVNINSNGAFKIVDKNTGEVMGGTRFYEYDAVDSSIVIGGTFYATKYWGTGVNKSVKKIMLDYIFNFLSKVHFHIDENNIRSQIAIGRIGAVKVGERPVNEVMKDFVYCITKEEWVRSFL